MAYVHFVYKGEATLNYLVACCSSPMRDNISLLVAFFLVNHKVIIYLMIQVILSAGRRASMCIVSTTIPKKVSSVEGPATFSIARGTPSSWQNNVFDQLQISLANNGGRWP